MTINYYLWRSYLYNDKENFINKIGTLWKGSGLIFFPFIKKIIKVNRGNTLLTLPIKFNMVGFNIKDFFVTKKLGSSIHSQKKKKKGKKGKRKGYIVNPIGVRLQFHGAWKDGWAIDKLCYAEFLHNILQLRKYFLFFMTSEELKNMGVLFSHVEILRQGTRTIILVFTYDGEREEMWHYGLHEHINYIKITLKRFFKKYSFMLKKRRIANTSLVNKNDRVRKEKRYKYWKEKLMGIFMVWWFMPFYRNLAKVLENKASVISILTPEVKFYGITNNGITSQLLSRFLGLKLQKGFTLMELINPIRKELLVVKKEEKWFYGFKFKFKGRFKRRNRSKKIVVGVGKMPLSTTAVYMDYSFSTVVLRNSICGIKVWLCEDPRLSYSHSYKID